MTPVDGLAALRRHGPDRAVECALLGGWLLEQAGLGAQRGEATVAPGGAGDRLALEGSRVSGIAHGVPWARDAACVVLVLDGRAVVVERGAVAIEHRINIAGDARDTVVLDGTPSQVGGAVDPEQVFMRGALTRVALMAGALDQVYEIAVRHARQRVQFGRPIASFQAVQELLVTIAQQAALAGIGADAAARRPGGFEIAAGKLLANRAALLAGRAAHQVLGARGTTREHPLGRLTLRLWAWRSEYGDERHWSTRLGAAAARAGADALYPAITGGSAVVSV